MRRRMNTINDVAKLAGVSIGTVSNVINKSKNVSHKTEERVKNAIKELNYMPNTIAKSLKTKQSHIIGVIAEDVGAFMSGKIIDGICDYCENYDYIINLCNLRVNSNVIHTSDFSYKEIEESLSFRKNVENSLNVLMTSRVCGLIYIGVHPRDVGCILPHLDIPVIYTYAYTNNHDYCINYDDYQGAKLATEYLIEKGHERIALICGPINSVPAHKRMMGYQTCLMNHNIPLYPEYVRAGNWNYEDGYNQCLELLHLNNSPTAIFAMNDTMAYGAINAAIDNGYRVPEDISAHGFDNRELSAYTNPALTTVNLPLFEMGVNAARTLLDILNETPPKERGLLIPCSHVERQTVREIGSKAKDG